MSDKKADNIILSKKERINKIDNMLDDEKKRIKKLENIQSNYHNLNTNISKCTSLLAQSIHGNNINDYLSDIQNTSEKIMQASDEQIDSELKSIKKRVNKLYFEKEKIIKDSEKEKK